MDSRTTEHPPAEGHEDEQSHEKTSVFKKVKAKAKRIKDTLKKHGQGPDQDHDNENHPDERHIPDDHDLDKEDDKDAEMVEDPKVHARTETENSGKSKLDFGRLAAATRPEGAPSPGERHESNIIKPTKGIESGEKPHAPQNTPVSRPPGDYGTKATDPTKTSVLGQGGGTGQHKVNSERPMGLEEDRHAPKDRSETHTPANYQTKVTDPKGTGGEEAGIAPIIQSFDKMKVHDELKLQPKPTGPDDNSPTTKSKQFTKSPIGSHDQFSPEPVPPEAKIVRDKSQLPESFDATKLPDDSRDLSEEPMNQRSSTEKISPPTSTISDKAIFAKNAVASMIGYGEPKPKPTGPDDDSPTTITKLPDDSRDISEEPMNQRSSTEKISSATPTIADKAIFAKNAVASKIGYGEPKPKPTGPDDNSITKLPDDSRDISEEPMNQRSSTEKISPATPTIADKAIFAKNAVASKIGYGEPKPKPTGPDDNSPTTITKLPDDSRDISEEPMNQKSSTEKIPPATPTIADKAIFAKNAVASKIGYGEPKPKPTGPDDDSITKLPDDSRDISEEPMNQRSSTEKISPATSTIADKAISAKNAVAAKIGYGEKDMTSGTEVRQSGDNAKSSPAEYGKKIAVTETEKQNPVSEKVAEAGGTAISKVHGTGTTDTDPGIGNESRSSDVKGQDKGGSVKDYFMEKSRPGNEDRALAEVISDTLHKPNEKPGEGEMRPMGKVTESEEVARRLGTKEDSSCQGMQSSDVNNSQEKGVVDKFKGAVGSWFGLGGESQSQVSPQPHDGSSYGDEGISRSANRDGENSSPTADEGKRLQEN